MKDLTKRNLFIALGLVLFGLFMGWLIFSGPGSSEQKAPEHTTHTHKQEDETIWTCSMHPQVRQQEPGQCPICGMDLIPVSETETASKTLPEGAFTITEQAMDLAQIQTSMVRKQVPEKETYMPGKIAVDERKITAITARFGGRIENLNINFTGQSVNKGEVLGTIYSPELITAQKEFLEAIKYKDTNLSLYRSARKKLALWELTEAQINKIEQSKEVQEVVPIVSPHAGIVSERKVAIGDYVKEGSEMFEVVDLSRVWVLFDAYETDLPWIEKGDKVNFTVKALPGQTFEARVTFIDPFISPKTRTAKVRAESDNPGRKLKPGMLASGTIHARLGKEEELVVPQSAVLWTGKRSVVYVELPDMEPPAFTLREIVLGPNTGSHYIVKEGLEQGDEVVTHGVFKVDAAAQLQGKPSMMGGAPAGHEHGDHQMKSERTEGATKKTSFKVYGNCTMCKERIEGALKDVKGIQQAIWDVDSKMLELIYNPEEIELLDVHKRIAEVGHDTEIIKADTSIYGELPKCCQYTRPTE